mmetsp:Transcript_13482/g.31520  ORF Transcript_13482/g.31520 Transcript_13482/m.31520 type:complete len:324 (-) Transcript_13482:339-1310(-)
MMQSNADRNNDPEQGDDPLAPSDPPNASRPGQARRGAFWRSRINEVQFPLVMVAGASIVLLIAVCTWETGMTARGYKISVPSLSLAVSIIGLLLTVYREDLYALYGHNLAHVLFLWNFTGACFLTFSSPFVDTGNGYFAAWGCVATSAMAMGLTAETLRNRIRGLGSLMGLCASAAIVFIALIQHIGNQDPEFEDLRVESVYAMLVSSFTIVLCLGLLYFQKKQSDAGEARPDRTEAMIKYGFLLSFAIMWFFLAFLVTFRGPFVTTGNGYFASWCGAVCACSAAFNARNEYRSYRSNGQVVDASYGENEDVSPPTGLSATIT